MLLMKKNFPASQNSLNSPGKLLFVNRIQSEAKYVSSHRNQNTTALCTRHVGSLHHLAFRSLLVWSEKRVWGGGRGDIIVVVARVVQLHRLSCRYWACPALTSPKRSSGPATYIKLSPAQTEICVNSNLSEILSLNQLLKHYLCLWPLEFLWRKIFSKI